MQQNLWAVAGQGADTGLPKARGSLWRGEHQTPHQHRRGVNAAPAAVTYCKGNCVFTPTRCSSRWLGVCNRESKKQTAAQGRDHRGQRDLSEANPPERQQGVRSWQSSGSAGEELAFSHPQKYGHSKHFIFSSFSLKGKS